MVGVEDLSLRVEAGEIVSILGPSGCGKTTLLRACCGLEHLETGNDLRPEPLEDATTSDITMLFQQLVLYLIRMSHRTWRWALPRR